LPRRIIEESRSGGPRIVRRYTEKASSDPEFIAKYLAQMLKLNEEYFAGS
jgi:hypothetical protein